MINRRRITEKQAREAITKGEFSEELTSSQKHVAIILTQSWCPQWTFLNRSLNTLEKEKYDIDIYELEYDKEDYFNEFLTFKENVLGNDQIPYIRYYINGKLIAESNYVSTKILLSKFNLN